MAIGGTIAGIQGALSGHGFWQAFAEHVSGNVVEALVTSFAFSAVSVAASNITKCFQCFKEGTPVSTADGLKAIEEIREGDLVLAYDEETGDTAYKRVTHLFRNETTEWYKIRVNGEAITCTAGHPFYLPAIDKFIPAEQLEIGENLLLSNGEYGIIGVVEGLIKKYMQLDVKNRKKRPIFNRIMWYNEDDRFVGSSKNAGLLAN